MIGPRYTIVASALRTRIAAGDVASDGALESEAELCERHGVSRITVRRALDELRRDGLVEPRQGAGWYVVPPPSDTAVAVVSSSGDTAVAQLAGTPPPVLDFEFVPAGDVAPTFGVTRRSKVLRYRRLHENDRRPYELETGFFPADIGRAFTPERVQQRLIWVTLRGLGFEVSRITQTLTAVRATVEQATLLGIEQGDALLYVERVGYSGDRPVDVSHHHYPGGRVVLDMEFHQEYIRAAETAGIRLMPMKTKPRA